MPTPIKHPFQAPKSETPAVWLFFRPSDQTVRQKATQLEEEGSTVFRVQTLAAFEALLEEVDAVFYDWCITDYGALSVALDMAVQANIRQDVFFALDLVDLAEDLAMKDLLMTFNQSIMSCFNHVYPLWTRPFLAERYGLAKDNYTLTPNIPNPEIWTRQVNPFKRDANAPLRFAYHGLFYFWHEIFEFIPVFQKITEQCDATLDIFGRVHDSVDVGGDSLFPKTEEWIKDAYTRCAEMSGIRVHGFTPPEVVRDCLLQTDYYVGITQGTSLMSSTEMRTGVEEALCLGCTVLHKTTPAITIAGIQANRSYIPIDSRHIEMAVSRIMDDCHSIVSEET